TQLAPPCPQAFTCSMCVPVDEEMVLSIDWSLMIEVSLLLSNEYPIETTFFDEQTDAYADSLNGEETSESFAGLLTVTPASAGSERPRIADDVMIKFRKRFIRFLCDRRHKFAPTPHMRFARQPKAYSIVSGLV